MTWWFIHHCHSLTELPLLLSLSPPVPEECKEECSYNAVCLVERLGVRCSCEPIQCDGTYKPLCGKDGRTYANDCERRRAECLAKTHIPIKQQGPCGEWSPPWWWLVVGTC